MFQNKRQSQSPKSDPNRFVRRCPDRIRIKRLPPVAQLHISKPVEVEHLWVGQPCTAIMDEMEPKRARSGGLGSALRLMRFAPAQEAARSAMGSAYLAPLLTREVCRAVHCAAVTQQYRPQSVEEKSRCFSLADSIGHVKRMAGRSARRCCTVACSGLLLESARFSNVSSSAICMASQRNVGPNAIRELRIRVRTVKLAHSKAERDGCVFARECWVLC